MSAESLHARLERFQASFFVCCVALVAALHFMVLPGVEPWLAEGIGRPRFFGWAAVVALLVLGLAAVSYPRIYKFKILLSGHLLVAWLLLFVLRSTPGIVRAMQNAGVVLADGLDLRLLFLLLMSNLMVVLVVPAYLAHATARRWALIAFLGDLGGYAVLLVVLGGELRDAPVVAFLTNHFAWIMGGALLMLIGVAWFHIEEEHNFGSVIAGIGVVMYYASFFLDAPGRLEILVFLMGFLFVIGTVYHWLGCLQHKAQYDPLLKIYNRQFMNAIVEGIADVQLGERFSVLLCDLDHFKKVNDTYGHLMGDRVLFRVAQAVREEALPEGIVCRYGGEELIVFLRGLTGKRAEMKAEHIRAKVEGLRIDVGRGCKAYRPTASIGVASTDRGLADIKETIHRADGAVYQAKEAGRNRVVFAG